MVRVVQDLPPGRRQGGAAPVEVTVHTIDATLARLASILASPQATIAELRERDPDLPDTGRAVEAAYIDLRTLIRAEIDAALDTRLALAA